MNFKLETVTIPSGATGLASKALFIGDRVPVAIFMPAAWQAAAISFQGSIDGTNFYDLYDDGGNQISLTVAQQRTVVLAAGALAGVPYLKFRSGLTGAAVDQTAERVLTVMLRS